MVFALNLRMLRGIRLSVICNYPNLRLWCDFLVFGGLIDMILVPFLVCFSFHIYLSIPKYSVTNSDTRSGKKEAVKAEEVEMVNWQRLAGGWGIRMFTKDGNLHRYAGFKEAEREKVAKHFSQNFNLDMLDRY